MFKKMKVGDVVTIKSAEEAELLKQIEGPSVWSDFKYRKCQIERIDDPILKYSFKWYDKEAQKDKYDTFHLPDVPPIPDGYEPAFEGEVVGYGWKFCREPAWTNCLATIGHAVHESSWPMIKPKVKGVSSQSLPEPMKDNEYAHFETREEWERFKEINDLSKMQLQSTCLENIDKHYATQDKFYPFYLASARGHITGYALSSTTENLKFILQFSTETKEYTGHKKHAPKQEPQIIRNESGTAVGVAEEYLAGFGEGIGLEVAADPLTYLTPVASAKAGERINAGQAVLQYAGKVFPFKSLSFTEQPVNQEAPECNQWKPSGIVTYAPRSTPETRAETMRETIEATRMREIAEVVKIALENM